MTVPGLCKQAGRKSGKGFERTQTTSISGCSQRIRPGNLTPPGVLEGETMKYQLALLCVFVALAGCKSPFKHNLPPAQRLMQPGPGVDGPGPGVMMLGDPGPMPMP